MLTNYSTHLTLRRNGFDVRGFSFPYDSLLRYYDDGARNFDIRRLDVAADTRRRGIPESLDYPYLPQALRYWGLVRSYVASYVTHYYAADSALAADVPAQLWFEALDRYLRGGVRCYAPTLDRDNLIRLCTLIIYSLSVGHTENSVWQYAPFMPTSVRSDGAQQSVGEAQLTLNFQFLICSPTTLLMDDMSHLALDEGAAQVMRQFRDALSALQREMEGQPDRHWQLRPTDIEAAVSA